MKSEERRVETGVVQIGDDWPGVFIRGDNALGFYIGLETLLSCVEAKREVPAYLWTNLRVLRKLFRGCDARLNPDAVMLEKTPPREPQA